MLVVRAMKQRAITLVPTATSGVPAAVDTTVHHPGPTATRRFKSDTQHKVPVGIIVGVAIAVIVGISIIFFVRWLFVRRKARRATANSADGTGVTAHMKPYEKETKPVPGTSSNFNSPESPVATVENGYPLPYSGVGSNASSPTGSTNLSMVTPPPYSAATPWA